MIRLFNRQKQHPIPLKKLQTTLEPLPGLLRRSWPRNLNTVEILFVSPNVSARVHRDFFQDPSPTDVMTFEHGEILICPAIAARQRHLEGLSLPDELLTYAIHGILHLCGYDDLQPKDYTRMSRAQTRLRHRLLALNKTKISNFPN
ncbi:MAG: rRNA maturation RNase YbeY [Blastochloris sp.]|nr:rRNA maturation RNase YbeY [Blastochloris sp.]